MVNEKWIQESQEMPVFQSFPFAQFEGDLLAELPHLLKDPDALQICRSLLNLSAAQRLSAATALKRPFLARIDADEETEVAKWLNLTLANRESSNL